MVKAVFTTQSFQILSNLELEAYPNLKSENILQYITIPFENLVEYILEQSPALLTSPLGETSWEQFGLSRFFSPFGFLVLKLNKNGLKFGFQLNNQSIPKLDYHRKLYFLNFINYENLLVELGFTKKDTDLQTISSQELTQILSEIVLASDQEFKNKDGEILLQAKTRYIEEQYFSTISSRIINHFSKVFILVLLATLEHPEQAILEYTTTSPNNTENITKINQITAINKQPIKLNFVESQLQPYLKIINRKKQIIFQGSPGTGKTFMAEQLAQFLIKDGDGFYELVQFHPSYAYEDFMQGIRPQGRKDGGLDYKIIPGRFLEFCQEASQHQDICVLIIDEINRANIAQVFGELMYLLEYRDRKIRLAASNQLFSIPENVRIIGTMNTADRSIALVDHALRRRFAFITIRPNYEVLQRYHNQYTQLQVTGLIAVLKELNQAINDSHYEVGISFFLTPNLAEDMEDIWSMEIEPYLEEYFFDQPDKVADFRWDKIKNQIMN